MAKKKDKIDGLGPDDLRKLHKAVRQVWQWSHAWQLAKKRAAIGDDMYRCENPNCLRHGQPVAKVAVDHIESVGEIGGPEYIQRMFVPSAKLQCLCTLCHKAKTKAERTCRKESVQ